MIPHVKQHKGGTDRQYIKTLGEIQLNRYDYPQTHHHQRARAYRTKHTYFLAFASERGELVTIKRYSKGLDE
jgi:nucleoside-specific outer membrane channel protein Tsx